MTLLAALLIQLFAWQPTPASAEPVPLDSLEPLAWLAGAWTGNWSNGATIDETWSPPRGNGMTGMMRITAANGDPGLHELMNITRDDAGIVTYRIRHFDATLNAWPADREPGDFTLTALDATDGAGAATFTANEPARGVRELVFTQTDAGLNITLTFTEPEQGEFTVEMTTHTSNESE